jgi:site-specific DNA-methyltransferase (adenine-specific)
MDQQKVEQLFKTLDKLTTLISEERNLPYLDSLVEAGEIIFYMQIGEDEISKAYDQFLTDVNLDTYEREEIRKALQLAILKGMKGVTQQHHYITPDSVAIFMGYLLEKFMKGKENYSIFDPACGTGNLLTAVLNQLSPKIQAIGSEVDSTLLQLAFVNANLQKRNIEFHHQDSLRNLLIDPQDVIISDLPVGYYPDDEQAKAFELRKEDGHSYAHHLFIEQSLRYTKPGGYLLFLVPVFLFTSDQSDQLNKFIHQYAHIQGVLQLPSSMFKNEQNAKCIFMLQKKGKDINPPKKVLMAQLPSFKDVHAMNKVLIQINDWFKKEK